MAICTTNSRMPPSTGNTQADRAQSLTVVQEIHKLCKDIDIQKRKGVGGEIWGELILTVAIGSQLHVLTVNLNFLLVYTSPFCPTLWDLHLLPCFCSTCILPIASRHLLHPSSFCSKGLVTIYCTVYPYRIPSSPIYTHHHHTQSLCAMCYIASAWLWRYCRTKFRNSPVGYM